MIAVVVAVAERRWWWWCTGDRAVLEPPASSVWRVAERGSKRASRSQFRDQRSP